MKFNEVLKLYKAMADESRLRLICIFAHGDFHVNELTEILDMGQSRVSRHLKILHEAGLLTTRREGTYIFYSLRRDSDPLIRATTDLLLQYTEKLTPDEISVSEYIHSRKLASAKFFDEVALCWDKLKKQCVNNDQYLSELKNLVDHSKMVVELGSGTGALLISLAQPQGYYLGIDMSEEMVKIAANKAALIKDTQLEFRLGDIENAPLNENACSTVIISMVLHHLLSPDAAIKEACRILAPRGKLIVYDFWKHNDDSYREIYNHRWLGFTKENLEKWFAECGFGECVFKDIADAGPNKMFICYAHKN